MVFKRKCIKVEKASYFLYLVDLTGSSRSLHPCNLSPGVSLRTFGNRTNRTPLVRLGSVIEHNRTHSKIQSIEHNRTFDCQTVDNRSQSNVRLPNSCLFDQFCSRTLTFSLIFFGTFFYLFHSIKVDYGYSCAIYLFSGVKRWIPNKIESDFVRLVR